MLIHKEWVQRPRRHRKKRNTNLDGGEPQEEAQIMCQYCPKRFKSKNEMLRHENTFHLPPTSWSCATLLRIEAAFYSISSTNTDVCGYCGGVFLNPPQWAVRAEHLNNVHKFRECNRAKKFFRVDHFRQHLKHSHQATGGRWTSMLETACMTQDAVVDLATPYANAEHTSTSTTQPFGSMEIYRPHNTNLEPIHPDIIEHFEEDIWQPRDNYAGYASTSSMSSASMASTDSKVKKRRLPRDEDAYVCDFPGCDKTYDRQCDLRHHKRCHRSEDDLPCPCHICGKRCPFPKDLRRHMKTHEK
jgi:hypothetical protein